jgi:hypothetical protein
MTEQQNSDIGPQEPLPDSLRRFQLPVVTLDHNPILGYFKVEDGDPDTNEKHGDDAQALRRLFALQRAGVIRLLVPTVAMLENQQAGKEIDIQEWARRLAPLGFDTQDIFAGMLSIAASTPDDPHTALYGAEYTLGIYYRIHSILNRSSDPQAKNIDADWRIYRDRMCMKKWAEKRLGDIDPTVFAELDRLRWHSGNMPPKPTPALDACSPAQRAEAVSIFHTVDRQWNNAACDVNGLMIHLAHTQRSPISQHAAFVTSDGKILRQSTRDQLQAMYYPGHVMSPQEAAAYFEEMADTSP